MSLLQYGADANDRRCANARFNLAARNKDRIAVRDGNRRDLGRHRRASDRSPGFAVGIEGKHLTRETWVLTVDDPLRVRSSGNLALETVAHGCRRARQFRS